MEISVRASQSNVELQAALQQAEARIAELQQELAIQAAAAAQANGLLQQLQVMARIPWQCPNPVMRLGADGQVLFANPAARDLRNGNSAEGWQALQARLQALARATVVLAAPQRQEVKLGQEHYLVVAVAEPADNCVSLYLTNITSRYCVEQQLVEQRRTYETIFDQLPLEIIVLDRQLRFQFVNPASEPDAFLRRWMIGRRGADTWQQRQVPAELARLRGSKMQQVVQEGRGQSWEEFQLVNGQPRYYLRNLQPVFDMSGELLLVLGSGIDITARRLAEESVSKQREFYETVLNYLPVDIAVFDAQQRYMFTNASAIPDAALRQQLVGMSDADYLAFRGQPGALHEERSRRFWEAVESRQVISWDESITGRRGHKHMMRTFRAVFRPDDSLALVVGSGIDISARHAAEERQRQAEEELREQQVFIRQIVDTLPNIVYVIDENERLSFYNRAFQKAFPFGKAQPNLQPQLVLSDAQIHQVQLWRRHVLRTGLPLSVEVSLHTAEREPCHMQVHMRPLLRANGTREVLLVATDITELKKAQQESEANAQAKEEFLSRMSHEIRTPLNGVLGMVNLLRRTGLDEVQLHYLDAMQQAGQHLLALVNDVLDLAKISAQHLQLHPATFDLAVMLQGAIQTVAPLAEQKQLALQLDCRFPDSPRVLADAYRLHQVLLNMLSNAIKFTDHGRVTLGVEQLRATEAQLVLRFWVQDTGRGIEPNQHGMVFEAFSQAGADSSTAVGTGLGLAISEQLVHHMGGQIVVCSAAGEGAIFSFVLTLPLVHDTPPDPQRAEPATTFGELRGLRVLLAEDNVVNQMIVKAILEHWGVDLHTVSTGSEALVALRESRYDAALLDIRMPGLSGVEVTQAVRQLPDPRRAKVPIIAVTANVFASDVAKYLAVGMNGCVTKPFQEAELCRLLLALTRPGVS